MQKYSLFASLFGTGIFDSFSDFGGRVFRIFDEKKTGFQSLEITFIAMFFFPFIDGNGVTEAVLADFGRTSADLLGCRMPQSMPRSTRVEDHLLKDAFIIK